MFRKIKTLLLEARGNATWDFLKLAALMGSSAVIAAVHQFIAWIADWPAHWWLDIAIIFIALLWFATFHRKTVGREPVAPAIEHLPPPLPAPSQTINITVKNEETHSRVAALEALLKAETEKREATERANAERLKKLTEPRAFTAEQESMAKQVLSKWGGTPFILKPFPDPESTRFSDRLCDTLIASGWKLAGHAQIGSMSAQAPGALYPKTMQPIGVKIEINNLQFKEAAEALDSFLKECDMLAHVAVDLNPGIIIGGSEIHLWIGTKS